MKICGGQVFGADHRMHQKDLCFENGIITEFSKTGEFNAEGCYVLPGFIDTHIHGAKGVEFWKSEEDMTPALDWLAKNGITGILVALTCQSPDELKKDAEKIAKLNDSRVIGIHAEGPFINPIRKGGMNKSKIQKPDASLLHMINEASGGRLKIMTMAPELEGIEEVIDECVKMGVKASMGHSDATYEQTKKAVDRGASRLTHTFNAMRPYNHRETGIIGAALDDDRVSCELICDLYHVSAPAIRLITKMKGCDNVTMISDSSKFCGMGDGKYLLDGWEIYVKDGLCLLADGTISGSSRSLFDGAKNMHRMGFAPEQIAVMAAVNPAKACGCEDRGELIEGYRADILVVDSDFNLKAVFVKGDRIV